MPVRYTRPCSSVYLSESFIRLSGIYPIHASTRCQFRFQSSLHVRPFRIDNAEPDAIANPAARADDMIAENSFLLRANPENGVAGLLVERVGLEFHAEAVQLLEGMAQQEVLGFGIGCGPLPWHAQPGRADFHVAV